jgi:hypothetical protein
MRIKRISSLFVFTALNLALLLSFVSSGYAGEQLSQKVKNRDTSFYRDFFDSVFYESIASNIRFDDLGKRLTLGKLGKSKALDINAYDEVPDSGFFVNRHTKTRLSKEALVQGPAKGSGPNPQGPWRVLKGKVEGVSTGFFIKDAEGVEYLLKFNPKSNPEMATSAEMISHRFFYAMGYYVPEYYLVDFKPTILEVDSNATYYNENGFKKKLTKEALWDLIDRVPKRKGGILRASASKLLQNRRGYMDFRGRRISDPDDLIAHENRRSIRALRVFGSWLNHYDLRKGNTLDVVETEDGSEIVKHYLIDFGSTLGSAADHAKVPVAGHEHIVDWSETGRSIPALKVTEKPWEKRWDAANRKIAYSSLGYFDNFNFDPGKWKTQLHYDAFEALTRGDAFWATKLIMSFTDDEIRSVVATGQFSDPENTKILSEILIARRDLIGKYWFTQTTPLDGIRLYHIGGNQYEISFTDLSIQYGFSDQSTRNYRYCLKTSGEGSQQKIEFTGSSFAFDAPVGGDQAALWVQARNGAQDKWTRPALHIALTSGSDSRLQIAEIDHGI